MNIFLIKHLSDVTIINQQLCFHNYGQQRKIFYFIKDETRRVIGQKAVTNKTTLCPNKIQAKSTVNGGNFRIVCTINLTKYYIKYIFYLNAFQKTTYLL